MSSAELSQTKPFRGVPAIRFFAGSMAQLLVAPIEIVMMRIPMAPLDRHRSLDGVGCARLPQLRDSIASHWRPNPSGLRFPEFAG